MLRPGRERSFAWDWQISLKQLPFKHTLSFATIGDGLESISPAP